MQLVAVVYCKMKHLFPCYAVYLLEIEVFESA